MAYSKAYQEVVAGRVREDESVTMFKKNQVAVPNKVTGFYPVGSAQQPVVKVDNFNDPNIAKPNTTKDPEKSAFNTGSNNVD